MRKETDYIDIKNSFRTLDNIKKNFLSEGEDKDSEQSDVDAVPYTQQDELMQTSIETAKNQFGADFSESKNPMLYYPKDGDVVLSGVIPGLNNAKFQFRFMEPTGNGCYFWVDSIQLTDENLKKMNIILGVYKNWKQELSVANDRKPMSMKNKM